jgi:hypothetical protein
VQLGAHRIQLVADRVPMQVELARSGLGALAQLLARNGDDGVDRGAQHALTVCRGLGPKLPGHDAAHDKGGEHRPGEHRNGGNKDEDDHAFEYAQPL